MRASQSAPASGHDYADLADAFDGDARCFSTDIMANGKKVFSSGELVFKQTLSTEALVKLDSAVCPYVGTSLWLVADADETGKRCEQFLCAVEPGDEFALEVVKDSERDMALGGVPTNRGIITAGIFVNVSSAPTKVVRSRFKRMYPTNSNQGYMMVDQGKFNKTDFYQSTQIDDLDGIIVDGDDEGIMATAIESSRSHPKLHIAK